MSSSDAEPAPSFPPFDGLTFLVHSHQGKRTKNLMIRFLELNGATTTRHASSDYLSHLVCERDLFAGHSPSSPDPVLREVLETNEQKRKEAGPDEKPKRVWIVPPEYVEACVKQSRKLDEEKWDLARNVDSMRASSGSASTSGSKKKTSGDGKRRRSEADSQDKKPQVKKKRSEATPSTNADVKPEKVKQKDEPKPQPRASSSSSASTKTSSSKTTAASAERRDEKPDLDRPLSASQTKISTSTASDVKAVPPSARMVGGKPESKPVVSVSRTFNKPASNQPQQPDQKKKQGMWGGIKRALPKQPGARASPAEAHGGGEEEAKDVKGKGKARATEADEGSSSDDEPLQKQMEKMADGAAFDDSGLSSLEDDD
ncbi:hypothetical protein JCM9279_005670 [Rhodotorula babjevae]